MKPSDAKYLMSTGLKNMWVNKLMSMASVGTLMACMLIIGVAAMLTVNVNNALRSIEQQNVIMCYFNDKNSVIYQSADPLVECDISDAAAIPDEAYRIHNEQESLAVVEQIKALDNVVADKVEYISKEESLATMEEKYLQGKDECIEVLYDGEDGNPLSDGARVVVSDMSRYNETAEALLTLPGVTSVQAQGDIADRIEAIGSALKTAGIWIIAILLLISLVIVSNTIRVTMYNRKLEISIMKAVGATDAFIRTPFMIEGVAIGLISSVLAFGVMYLMQNVIVQKLTSALKLATIVPFRSYALWLFLAFVALGVISGVFGSMIMMNKYLRKEGSEFRAL